MKDKYNEAITVLSGLYTMTRLYGEELEQEYGPSNNMVSYFKYLLTLSPVVAKELKGRSLPFDTHLAYKCFVKNAYKVLAVNYDFLTPYLDYAVDNGETFLEENLLTELVRLMDLKEKNPLADKPYVDGYELLNKFFFTHRSRCPFDEKNNPVLKFSDGVLLERFSPDCYSFHPDGAPDNCFGLKSRHRHVIHNPFKDDWVLVTDATKDTHYFDTLDETIKFILLNESMGHIFDETKNSK